MGQDVTFAANGSECPGYFAPAEGGGPGVVIIQEWWGIVPHIRDLCDRFAAAGFSALTPDLYRGVTTTEPDEAGKLMMSLNLPQAGKDISGAVDFLLSRPEVTSSKVGVIGFCMGGALALMASTQRPDAIGAAVPFYGVVPWLDPQPDWSALAAPVRGHFASEDTFFTPEKVRELEAHLRELGKDVEFTIHEGTEHAFCNDTRPEVYHPQAADRALSDSMEFLRTHLT
jgi:carboxymethylenebutenolidase